MVSKVFEVSKHKPLNKVTILPRCALGDSNERQGSLRQSSQILPCAQDDRQDPSQVRSREAFSQNVSRITPRDRFWVKSLRNCDTIFLERMSFLVDPGLKLRWTLTRCAWVLCSTVIFFPLLGKRASFFTRSAIFWHFQKKCPLLCRHLERSILWNSSQVGAGSSRAGCSLRLELPCQTWPNPLCHLERELWIWRDCCRDAERSEA